MTTREHNRRSLPKTLLSVLAIAVITVLFTHYGPHLSPTSLSPNSDPRDDAFVEKLKSAKRFRSQVPAHSQTVDMAKSSLRRAAVNAIGLELRDVEGMASGDPESVFAMLSHLGGFGEIIWVDQWPNFPVKLPPTSVPGQVMVTRRDAVRAAIDAIEATGGCLIKAGEHRYLVAKISEQEKYEIALCRLGWLNGNPPPWAK